MSAYSATPHRWATIGAGQELEVHLTRRGRLARTVALLGVCGLFALSVVDTIGGEPALADDSSSDAAVSTRSVVVDRGDSLWRIASTVAPDVDPRKTIEGIRELNGLRSSNLQPGQVLLIPRAG